MGDVAKWAGMLVHEAEAIRYASTRLDWIRIIAKGGACQMLVSDILTEAKKAMGKQVLSCPESAKAVAEKAKADRFCEAAGCKATILRTNKSGLCRTHSCARMREIRMAKLRAAAGEVEVKPDAPKPETEPEPSPFPKCHETGCEARLGASNMTGFCGKHWRPGKLAAPNGAKSGRRSE